jgi:hypothetical protein
VELKCLWQLLRVQNTGKGVFGLLQSRVEKLHEHNAVFA